MKKTHARLSVCALLVTTMLSSAVLPVSAARQWQWGGSNTTTYTVSVTRDPDPTTGGANPGNVVVADSITEKVEGNGHSATIKEGRSADFMALPRPYRKITGWYDGETLLSTKLGFTLDNITSDRTITAKFDWILGYHEDHSEFTAWSNPNSMPTEAGNYYLTTDVTLDDIWAAPDGVVLCLNGHVLKNTNVGGTITVSSFDQVVVTECNYDAVHYFDVNGIGQWIPSEGNSETPYYVEGGYITGAERGIYIENQGALHMYDGNVVGVCGDLDGPGVSVSDGGIFYMYGGSIKGNVNTYTGAGKGGVRDYDGGGGLFVDRGSRAYLLGISTISDNTALYTNNGGGVYNYRGEVYVGEDVYITGNKGENGAESNYQSYGSNTTSVLHVPSYTYFDGAKIGISNTGAFTDKHEGGVYDFDGNDITGSFQNKFFSDKVNYEITKSTSNILSNTKQSVSGYVVTAGTRGAGSATVNGEDGSRGVIVSKNGSATLVATPASADYMFIGWYDENGALITTNDTYTINRVTADKNVQAYFTLNTTTANINTAGSYQLFNSGDSKSFSSSEYRYKNSAFSTLTNENQFLYFHNEGSETYYDEEGPVGLPFTIDGKVLEKSVVTMNCFDVDESSGERDKIYLLDLTNNTREYLGYLTGSNQKWTTTSFTVDPELLQEGHTYQLYLENSVYGWVAWIDTASISIGEMETEEEKIETVTTASIVGSISSQGVVSGTLTVEFAEAIPYRVEYKATHIATNNQLGYHLTELATSTVGENTPDYSFNLESGADKGAYRIDAYILDEQGNVLKTVNCTAGYAYSAVTYHANGGTNNLPEDTNTYSSGNQVTVKFDYIPSLKVRTEGEFIGWSTNKDATTPEYTKDGTNTFTIGDSDVTLYAIYHVHTAGEKTNENVVEPTCTEAGSHDEVVRCTECNQELSREAVVDAALGHDMGEWEVITAAGDGTEGSRRRDCQRCDYYEEEKIPALGHTYTSVVTAPTCTERGYTTYTCETCDDEYTADYVAALGHDEVVVSGKAATCTETGLTEGKKCQREGCGITLVEQTVIPAIHNPVAVATVAPKCTEEGYTTYTCPHCGVTHTDDYVAALGHDYDVTTHEPNCTESGYDEYNCSRCGYSYDDNYVNALGHIPGEWVQNPDDTTREDKYCVREIEPECNKLLESRYSATGGFEVTSDAGYYGETRKEELSGIVAFNTRFTDDGGLDLSNVLGFGICLININNPETPVVASECVSLENFQKADGQFFATISDINPENFGDAIYAKPYYVAENLDGEEEVHYGPTFSTKVDATGKWLGMNFRTVTFGDIIGLEQ